MINDPDLFTIRKVSSEHTEDGDLRIGHEIKVLGEAGKDSYYEAKGSHYISEWEDAGDGWLKATIYTIIDATEIAIEKANDSACWRSRAEEDSHQSFWGW